MKKIIDTVVLPLLSVSAFYAGIKVLGQKPVWLLALLSVFLHIAAYVGAVKLNNTKLTSVLILPNIGVNALLALEVGYHYFKALNLFPLVTEIVIISLATCLYYRYFLKIKVAGALAYATLSLLYIVAVSNAKSEKSVLIVYGMIFLYGLLAIVHGTNSLKVSKEDSSGKLLHLIGSIVILSIPILNAQFLSSTHLMAILNSIPVYYSITLLWIYFGLHMKSKYLAYPAVLFLSYPVAKLNPIYGIIIMTSVAVALEVFWQKLTTEFFND